jgi:signal transduction histidine kinase
MRLGLPSLLVRPAAPPLKWGLVVAASLIVAETLVLYPLKRIAFENTLGVVYVLGVVVVAIVWGFWLAAATSVASVLAFDYFHIPPVFTLSPTQAGDWVAIIIFLVVALAASTLAGAARARAAEAGQQRRHVEASRDELSVLANQQAALRRVATLVARGVSPSEVFSAVADETARCLRAGNASVNRFDGDHVVILALSHLEAGMENKPVVGERFSLEGNNVAATVLHTGHAARQDSSDRSSGAITARLREMGISCTVAVPIVVDGRVWGMAAVASSAPEPLPPDTEARISDFADLVATAIANAATRADLQASRDELAVLADQQAALRRVATLVARGVSPSDVFSAVAVELARCLGVHHTVVFRYEPDGEGILVAAGEDPLWMKVPIGTRVSFEGDNVPAMVYRSGRTTRMDGHVLAQARGFGSAYLRRLGVRSTVGAPIIVDGRLWGIAGIASTQPDPLPPDTEARVGDFTDLVATAIANAQTHAELTASRARIVAAADEARRRIERDLHDGAQQRLVSLALEMRTAEASMPPELHSFKEQISHLVTGLAGVSQDLQEISRGIHPAILSKGGLGPALKTLARRSTVPVELDVGVDRRLPDSVEVAAYCVVAEALTNAAKHAQASEVTVRVEAKGAHLRLLIRDDGLGGADTAKGSGLTGLVDRVEALGGKITISSRPGNGTSLHAAIPLDIH